MAPCLAGRHVRGRARLASGANPATARQSGINVFFYGVLPYVRSALGASLGGLVFAAYMGLPDLQVSSLHVLGPIASAVIGATRLAGGEGTMLGTSAGALFLTFLSALIISFNLPEGVGMIITGAIIVIAIEASQKEAT
ncbi:MAG: ABC transporter permease subunit [Acetobacteraceae bacterium]